MCHERKLKAARKLTQLPRLPYQGMLPLSFDLIKEHPWLTPMQRHNAAFRHREEVFLQG
jgi:hypothetical protein